jgi:hypothetical protein
MTSRRERKTPAARQPAADRTALSPERAFVVQFRGPSAGRVEHVRSGEAARFESRDELLAFIDRLLAARKGTGERT